QNRRLLLHDDEDDDDNQGSSTSVTTITTSSCPWSATGKDKIEGIATTLGLDQSSGKVPWCGDWSDEDSNEDKLWPEKSYSNTDSGEHEYANEINIGGTRFNTIPVMCQQCLQYTKYKLYQVVSGKAIRSSGKTLTKNGKGQMSGLDDIDDLTTDPSSSEDDDAPDIDLGFAMNT
ncbi:hypothetical protein CPC16_004849, partial [Podila verticillata]